MKTVPVFCPEIKALTQGGQNKFSTQSLAINMETEHMLSEKPNSLAQVMALALPGLIERKEKTSCAAFHRFKHRRILLFF